VAKRKGAGGNKDNQAEKIFEFPLGERDLERRQAVARKAFVSGILDDQRDESRKRGDSVWRIIRYRRVVDPRHVPMRLPLDSFVLPETFERHMEYLAASCKPMSLKELIRRIDNYEAVPPNTVVVTFDGGHMDNYLYAFPKLVKYQIPATVFPVTGYIGSNNFFFEDRLALALEVLEKRGIALPHLPFIAEEAYALIEEISPKLMVNEKVLAIFVRAMRRISEEQKKEVFAQLGALLAEITEPPNFEDFVRWNDLRHMQSMGISVGMIGHSDIVATGVSPERHVADLIASIEAFKQQDVELERTYAFPEGLFDEAALDTLEKLQLRFALGLGVVKDPRYQIRVPMILGRVPMCELLAPSREMFACRLWGIRIGDTIF